MRLFQNSSLYPSYRPRLQSLSADASSFSDLMGVFFADRYGIAHVLQPVLQGQPDAFFTNGDDLHVQRAWAREHGMPGDAGREAILLAQIEEHRTEVFYNLDPMTFPGSFTKRLPSSVKRSIAWRAAPSGSTDFQGYDAMVSNFPGILQGYRKAGLRACYFFPAYDPEMNTYAQNTDRPIDIIFVGSFSRHHARRTEILKAVAGLSSKARVAIHLERSRFTALAESALGRWVIPAKYARPAVLRRVSQPPVFGRDLYQAMSRAKIVVNAAIDMAGQDRGNIRCFEAMGLGAALVTDTGDYPEGMVDAATMRTYGNLEELVATLESLLAAPAECTALARRGHAMVKTEYSKAHQWEAFQALLADLPAGVGR